MAEFTGERVIPGLVDPDLWNEHVARYVFASRFAAGRRVVDAGCGTGYGTARLAATAASAIGLDASSEAVAYAREHYSAENISFLQASCAALPLASASADLIVSFEVIEHIDCWQEFLVETRRVLGDTGLLIISTPNRDYYTEARATTGANIASAAVNLPNRNGPPDSSVRSPQICSIRLRSSATIATSTRPG